MMTLGVPRNVEETRRSKVQSVTEEGEVVLLLPDGQRRTVTIPLETVPLVRRLAALDREIDLERR